MKISPIRLFLFLTIVSCAFSLDTLIFRDAITAALTSNLTHSADMRLSHEAFYKQMASQRGIYPRVDLGMTLPSLSYREQDVYLFLNADPLRSWKQTYGFSSFIRLTQPTFWGGRLIIAPNISVFAERYNIYNPRDLTRQEILVSLRQPLLRDTDESFGYEVAKVDRDRADIELDIKRINLLLDLVNVYMNLYVVERNMERVHIQANLARDFLRDIAVREEAGEVRTDWMFTASARSMDAISDSIHAENQLKLRQEQLSNLLNFPHDTVFYTKEPVIFALELSDEKIESLFVKMNPDIEKARLELERERLEYREEYLKSRSNIFLNASYSYGGQGRTLRDAVDDFGESAYSLSLSTTIPVLDFGVSGIQLSAKRKSLEAKERRLEAQKRTARAEARIQIDKLHTNRERFEVQRQIVVKNENALNLIQQSYNEGAVDLGGLVDAFSQFRLSVERALSFKAEYYKTLFRIKIICGIPMDSNGIGF